MSDLLGITSVVESTMDGTSGAIYAIFLNALTRAFRALTPREIIEQDWIRCLEAARDTLSKYTSARPGDRTLIDALHPFIDTISASLNYSQAAKAARRGAESTKAMKASLGRTVYVGGKGFEEVPDPGAWGVAVFLEGFVIS